MGTAFLWILTFLQYVVGAVAVLAWVWAPIRAFRRGQPLWLVLSIILGPVGAIAYLIGSIHGDRIRAVYGIDPPGSASNGPSPKSQAPPSG
jgi:DMSO reductase anchor subunit